MIGEFEKVVIECVIEVDDIINKSTFIACTDKQLEVLREKVQDLKPTKLEFKQIRRCVCGEEVECSHFLQACACGLNYDKYGRLIQSL